VGDGYSIAFGRKLDEVGDDSTHPADTVMRSRIKNIAYWEKRFYDS